MTHSLFSRLAWLLGGTVAVVLIVGLVVLRLSGNGAAGEIAAHTIGTRIVAADALLAHGDEGALAALNVIHAPAAPVGRTPMLGMVRNALGQLREQFPGREIRIDGLRDASVWIAARDPAAGWLGVRLDGTRVPVFRAGLLTILLAGVVVLVAAALYARSLTAPLRHLAAAANGIVNGAEPPALPAGAARELTELRGALARGAADVRASRKERDLMLAALSHDMRTPLARLRLGLAIAAPPDEALRTGMEADIEALDALCEHFIAFARDGRDEPAASVDLAALCADVVAAAATHGEPWALHVPAACVVMGKPLALRRAVENLVRNATRHGAAPFALAVERAGKEAHVEIRDGGVGVPPDVLAHLGEPFVQGNAARSNAVGSGLGLASVRRTAEQHGGSLRLRNLPAGGFAATLVLPV
ncbi:ATP-binding protein [Luteibacter aegosomatissinici]|uniref:ATP-binding protein n=1 Tax=Luteibacter aegosomatissinici TaxID=2911539 RepID=UPI001FF980D8|nr:ATP-binding protein [Luteibacter aegosomatissinici]UPG94617.1 ATP-binding protein [Luteibacter aegosomatissinici]